MHHCGKAWSCEHLKVNVLTLFSTVFSALACVRNNPGSMAAYVNCSSLQWCNLIIYILLLLKVSSFWILMLCFLLVSKYDDKNVSRDLDQTGEHEISVQIPTKVVWSQRNTIVNHSIHEPEIKDKSILRNGLLFLIWGLQCFTWNDYWNRLARTNIIWNLGSPARSLPSRNCSGCEQRLFLNKAKQRLFKIRIRASKVIYKRPVVKKCNNNWEGGLLPTKYCFRVGWHLPIKKTFYNHTYQIKQRMSVTLQIHHGRNKSANVPWLDSFVTADSLTGGGGIPLVLAASLRIASASSSLSFIRSHLTDSGTNLKNTTKDMIAVKRAWPLDAEGDMCKQASHCKIFGMAWVWNHCMEYALSNSLDGIVRVNFHVKSFSGIVKI